MHDSNRTVVAVFVGSTSCPAYSFPRHPADSLVGLETAGYLEELAAVLDKTFGNIYIVNLLIGLLSFGGG